MKVYLKPDEQTKLSLDLNKASRITPRWSNSNGEVVKLEVANDGLSGIVTAHKKGLADVSVLVDIDLGSGFVNQAIVYEVEVTENIPAASLFVAVPVEKPAEEHEKAAYWTPDT